MHREITTWTGHSSTMLGIVRHQRVIALFRTGQTSLFWASHTTKGLPIELRWSSWCGPRCEVIWMNCPFDSPRQTLFPASHESLIGKFFLTG